MPKSESENTQAFARPELLRHKVLRRACQAVVRAYMRVWHELSLVGEGVPHLPPTGPALILVNHASALDVFALVAVDPFPRSSAIVKRSLYRVRPIRPLLHAWNAIPVDRDSRDATAIRGLYRALQNGIAVAVAVEGTRSRTGRMLPVNPVLARVAVRANVPLIPVGMIGTFEALPAGRRFPRRRKITIRVGMPFQLPTNTSADDAAQRIFAEVSTLLPPEQLPLTHIETSGEANGVATWQGLCSSESYTGAQSPRFDVARSNTLNERASAEARGGSGGVESARKPIERS